MTTRQIAATDVTGALGYTPPRLPGLATGVTQTGIMIPYYVYVSNPYNDSNFSAFLTLIRTHPTVPTVVIVNQAGIDGLGGPGPYDGNVGQMIRMLKAAGATVCGYVSTQNATRAAGLVQTDITTWNAIYPTTPVDGVFFDEVPYAVGTANANIILYKSYYDYAHANGLNLVIGNPGSQLLPAWYDTRVADIYVCHENTSWPALSSFLITPPQYYSGTTTDYWIRQFSILVYNSAWSQSGFDVLSPYFGWIYATDNPSPASTGNPWAALSSYLGTLYTAAASANAATFYAVTVGSATGPTIKGGTGAPSGTQPAGSLWLRTDGSTGTRLYVSNGSGTWTGVSGV
jgi:Spherulation-specific family 4